MKRIIFYCGNGYIYKEIFEPLVESMGKDYKILMLMSDSYLSDEVIKILQDHVMNNQLENFIIFSPEKNKGEWPYSWHKRMIKMTKDLGHADMLVMDNQCYIFNKYLGCWIKGCNGKLVILQTGTLWRLLEAYRRPYAEILEAIK